MKKCGEKGESRLFWVENIFSKSLDNCLVVAPNEKRIIEPLNH